jgi:hypothetical protein
VVARDAQGRAATVLERRLDPDARPTDTAWIKIEADLDPARAAVGPEMRFTFDAAGGAPA